MESKLIVTRSITITAPISRVWEALIKPESTRQYMFGCDIISDWSVGNPVIWKGASDGKVYVKGNVLEIEPEKRLVFTVFDPNSDLEDIPANYLAVTYNLSSIGKETILVVTQGDFATVANGKKRYDDTVGGWDTVLPILKSLVEE